MGDPQTIPAATEAPPDWATAGDLPCPLCSYNLRGLNDPRCPECGYAFSWPALLDARRTVHPYLFEHHPDRNLRSLARTSLATFLPRRFWRYLTPAHAIRTRRLLLYWVLTCLPLALLLTATVFLEAWTYRAYAIAQHARFLQVYQQNAAAGRNPAYMAEVLKQYGSIQAFVDHIAPIPAYRDALGLAWTSYRPVTYTYALWLCWPFVTAAALLLYRRSMRHAAIRPAHVLRCVLYSADLLFWPALAFMAYLAAARFYAAATNRLPTLGTWPGVTPQTRLPLYILLAWHALILIATYRLTVAYTRYLRFDRAWLAVPLASLAGLLTLWLLYITFSNPTNITYFRL